MGFVEIPAAVADARRLRHGQTVDTELAGHASHRSSIQQLEGPNWRWQGLVVSLRASIGGLLDTADDEATGDGHH